MNLAYVTPLPPVQSGVADYAATLLPYLGRFFERVTAVVDGYVPRLAPGLADSVVDAPASGHWWSAARAVPLYHMGNHFQYHRYVYEALVRFPGITVLHDGNLLPFIHELTLGRGARAAFVREAGFEQGRAGFAAAWASLRQAMPLSIDSFPMLARVARASLGVVVHSKCLRDRVLEARPGVPVRVIPHLDLMSRDARPLRRNEARQSLGLDPGGLVVGAFGFIAPSKRMDRALRAFARLRGAFPQARFVCVGEVVQGYSLQAVVDELALGDAVQVSGYVPMETFLQYLRAVDVGVNLRYPTWGEVSGTLIRLMACGVPTVVTDAGAFADLPDDVVVKVPAGPDEVEALEATLRELMGDAEKRAEVGAAAQDYVTFHCAPRRVAEQYAAFVRAVVSQGVNPGITGGS